MSEGDEAKTKLLRGLFSVEIAGGSFWSCVCIVCSEHVSIYHEPFLASIDEESSLAYSRLIDSKMSLDLPIDSRYKTFLAFGRFGVFVLLDPSVCRQFFICNYSKTKS